MWRWGLVRAALEPLGDGEMVCVVDAYDVLPLVDATELEARYREAVGADGGRVLLGMENPLQEPPMPWASRVIFGNCLHHRTVNAGGFLGTVGCVRKFLDVLMRNAARWNHTDDQKVLNRSCRELHALIQVDESGDFFFHATCVPHFPGWILGSCPFGLHIVQDDDRPMNPLTGRPPAILHAPAGLSLDSVCRRLRLPLGRRRSRWQWMLGNFWREWVVSILVLVVLVGLVRTLVVGRK